MSGERVPPDLGGERTDKIVAVLASISRAEARRMCDAGEVRADGEVVSARDRLDAGTAVDYPSPAARPVLEPEPVPFQVRYEDEAVLVVDKPAGVVVHPGAGRRSGTLAAGLLHRYPDLEGVGEEERWGLVHRLDRDTSGLLVVARTAEAHRALTAELAARRIQREYLALVLGGFDAPRGTIDAPIGTDPAHPIRRRVTSDGRPARTHYRVERQWEDPEVALLRVTLETGRTHQIRVHLASIDHPVVGDQAYGRPGPVASPRVFLHAIRLAFTHPVSGEQMRVESPLPPDLQEVLDRLGSRL